ncbi:hypothetical protein Tco_0829119 [Tanacetum coccineum]
MNQTPRQLKRGRDTKIPQSSGPPKKVNDEAVHKELGDRMERAATTASSLEVEQDNGNINRTLHATLNEPVLRDLVLVVGPRVNTLGSGEDNMKLMELMAHCTKLSELLFWTKCYCQPLWRMETKVFTATIDGKVKVVFEASIRRHLKLEDSDGHGDNNYGHAASTSQPPTSSPSMPTTHVAEEATPMPHDSPIPRVHLLGSDEGSLTLNELKVKKLEHNVKSIKARRKARLVISDDEDDLEDPSKQGKKIAQIDEDEGSLYISITTAEPVTTAGEGVSTARAIPKGVSTARAIPEEVSTVEPDMDVTLAEALVDLLKSGKKKSPKPKEIGISFQDPEEVARREVISPPVSKISAKDKGKAIMTEPEKLLKKKDQIQSDEELTLRLHVEEQVEFERVQKERAT